MWAREQVTIDGPSRASYGARNSLSILKCKESAIGRGASRNKDGGC